MPKNKAEGLTPDEYGTLEKQSVIIEQEYLTWPGIDAENQIVWVAIFATIERRCTDNLGEVNSCFVVTYQYPDTVAKPYSKRPAKSIVDAILLSRKLKRELLINELHKMRNAIEKAFEAREATDVKEESENKQLKQLA